MSEYEYPIPPNSHLENCNNCGHGFYVGNNTYKYQCPKCGEIMDEKEGRSYQPGFE